MSPLDLITLVLSTLPAFDGWVFAQPEGVPSNVLQLADPRDPIAQSRLWGAIYTDLPRGFLLETCLVESGCRQAIGVHAGDAHAGESVWRGVWERGKIDHSCAFYPDPDDVEDPAWFGNASTRGNHGLMAGYHVRMIGSCIPLEALDIPFFSAWAAAEKSRRACRRWQRDGKPCTRDRLRCEWAQATWGTKNCQRVVRRFHARVAALARKLSIETRTRVTLRDFEKEIQDGDE